MDGNISTHTPHARRDAMADQWCEYIEKISTHTPHARRDTVGVVNLLPAMDFNSHASCEA